MHAKILLIYTCRLGGPEYRTFYLKWGSNVETHNSPNLQLFFWNFLFIPEWYTLVLVGTGLGQDLVYSRVVHTGTGADSA